MSRYARRALKLEPPVLLVSFVGCDFIILGVFEIAVPLLSLEFEVSRQRVLRPIQPVQLPVMLPVTELEHINKAVNSRMITRRRKVRDVPLFGREENLRPTAIGFVRLDHHATTPIEKSERRETIGNARLRRPADDFHIVHPIAQERVSRSNSNVFKRSLAKPLRVLGLGQSQSLCKRSSALGMVIAMQHDHFVEREL